MKTTIIAINEFRAIDETLRVIKNGGVVAVPTDTVYGIACLVMNHTSIKSLYQIKERDESKPIPVLIGSHQQIFQLTSRLSPQAEMLIKKFWPGALTIIVEKMDTLPENLSRLHTVGIRMPNHDWLRKVISLTGPLAVTSANISGSHSPSTVKEVQDQLNTRIPLIIDGGVCVGGKPSTVVDCSQKEIAIIREGALSKEMIFGAI